MLAEVLSEIERVYGDFDQKSKRFDFDHTSYYEEEMGQHLQKQFFSLQKLHDRNRIVDLKLLALKIEKKFSSEGKREVNIDPAYLELAKLVVTSTKNFDHRIYIRDRIFGDVQLRFRQGKFASSDWTYPDYKSSVVLDFMIDVREIYYKQLSVEK